jgi:Dyp-type peroxidase family
MPAPQSGVFALGTASHAYLELDLVPDAPAGRTDQETFGTIFRRNMPYGTVTKHGTMFVGFCARQRPLAAMLESMAGLTSGTRDALTAYTLPLPAPTTSSRRATHYARSRRSYSGVPPSTQRFSRSTCSLGHGASQGIEPELTSARIGSAFALTSSYDQRSKCVRIAPRSRSRKRGLMSLSKLGVSSVMVCQLTAAS